MCTVYGYVRILTKKQSLERQVRNIKLFNSSAVIIEEVFTGIKTYGRKEWCKILKRVKSDDIIVFDSVSRMSRISDDGMKTYLEILDKDVNLIFLKERSIDTDPYKNSMEDAITLRGTDKDVIFIGINNYLRKLTEKQIRIVFEQSEKEVEGLHQRTSEGEDEFRNANTDNAE